MQRGNLPYWLHVLMLVTVNKHWPADWPVDRVSRTLACADVPKVA